MKLTELRQFYILADGNMVITAMNKHTAKISNIFLEGRRLEIGQKLIEYIPEDLKTKFSTLFEKAFSTGQSVDLNEVFIFSSSKALDLTVSLFPMFSNRQISSILIAIKQNLDWKTREPSYNRVLSKYAHITSHKLRAPLSNILSLSDNLEDISDAHFNADNMKDLLAQIRQQAENLDTVIFALNDLIRQDEKPQSTKALSGIILKDIVLIDDEPFVNRIHEKLIRTQFPEVLLHVFTDAALAFDFIRKFPPNLIILDLNMPGFNGWRFLKALQKLEIEIDVVMVTSSIDPEEKKKAFSFKNVRSFLTKPLTHAQLSMTLNPAV